MIPIGKIVKCQGNKGQVRLLPSIEDLLLNEYAGNVYTIDSSGTVLARKVTSIKSHKNFWVFQFEGINSINEAEILVGLNVSIEKAFFNKLPPGVYYWFEIIGLDVYDEKNNFIGKIDYIFSTGSNDIYVVKKEKSEERYLPAIKEVVKQIDLKKRRVIVHLIDGL